MIAGQLKFAIITAPFLDQFCSEREGKFGNQIFVNLITPIIGFECAIHWPEKSALFARQRISNYCSRHKLLTFLRSKINKSSQLFTGRQHARVLQSIECQVGRIFGLPWGKSFHLIISRIASTFDILTFSPCAFTGESVKAKSGRRNRMLHGFHIIGVGSLIM